MKPQRNVRLPGVYLRAEVVAKSAKADDRSVDATFYTGAEFFHFTWDEGEFLLSLSLDPSAVRLGRLRSGAPLLDSHRRLDGVRNVIGVVTEAKIEDGVGKATLRFSKRPEIDGIWQDVTDGVIRNLSVGARIFKLEELTHEKSIGTKRMRATDWEPQEISLVAVGADPGARIEMAAGGRHPCRIQYLSAAPGPQGATMKLKVRLLEDVEGLGIQGDSVEIEESDFDVTLHAKIDAAAAPKKTKKPAATDVSDGGDPESAITAARKVDREIERDHELAVQVKRAATHFGLDDFWAQRHINLRTPIDTVLAIAAEERAKRAPATLNSIGDDRESLPYRYDQMSSALAARATRKDPPESAREYADLTLVELAYDVLTQNRLHRGLNVRRNSARIVELALTTSDYPNLLANAANKILLPDYLAATPTYRMLSERQDLPDFKTASVLKAGDFPNLLQVAEEGEIKLGSFSEAKDTYALATYGRRLLFSFQSIVNDDLGAFGRIMRSAAVRLADFENALWFTLLTSASGVGPTLGDGLALFHTTHANYTASGTAIDVTAIGVMRALFRKQTSLDGLKLNLLPRFLLTSPDKETLARQYTTLIGPNVAPTSQNPWAGTLEPIADANLSSANPWYGFADPARAATSVYGYLSGQAGPSVATRQGFEVLGVEMRVALHFGTAFVDFRGAYRNVGA